MANAHPRLRELRYTLYRIFRNPSAIIGFTLLLFFVGVAVLAPVLAPPKYAHNPYQMPHKGFSPTPKWGWARYPVTTAAGSMSFSCG